MKREQSAFGADAAKEALNFNLIVVVGYAICLPLCLRLRRHSAVLRFCSCSGRWLTIVAGIKAGEGLPYRYSAISASDVNASRAHAPRNILYAGLLVSSVYA